jgi:hypothetical protein
VIPARVKVRQESAMLLKSAFEEVTVFASVNISTCDLQGNLRFRCGCRDRVCPVRDAWHSECWRNQSRTV